MQLAGDRLLVGLILAASLLGTPVASTGGSSLTVTELLEHGDRYHQQSVSVVGEVTDIATQTGPRNRLFYTFALRDGHGSVSVIMQGKPELSNGDAVLVHGVFIKSRKAGRTTLTNRIEATMVRRLHDTHEPFIG